MRKAHGQKITDRGYPLVVLRDHVIKPLLAASCPLQRGLKPKSPSLLDQHYDALRTDMRGLFNALHIAT